MPHTNRIIQLGDRVVVFTGRDYTTVAYHGCVVAVYTNGYIVYVERQDKYCVASSRDLLFAMDDGHSKDESYFASADSAELDFKLSSDIEMCGQTRVETDLEFAEIDFDRNFAGNTSGRFRQPNLDFTFEFRECADAMDARTELSKCGDGVRHFIVHCPHLNQLGETTCVELLCEIVAASSDTLLRG